jgi:hypothetical protein
MKGRDWSQSGGRELVHRSFVGAVDHLIVNDTVIIIETALE